METYSSRRIEEIARKAGREGAHSYMRDVEFVNAVMSLLGESRMESRIRQIAQSEVNNNLRSLVQTELAKSFRDYISRRSELESMVDEHRQKTAAQMEKMRQEEEARLAALRQQSLQGVEAALASIERRASAAAEDFSQKFLRQDSDNQIVRAIEAKMRAENEAWQKKVERKFFFCAAGGLLLGITVAASAMLSIR